MLGLSFVLFVSVGDDPYPTLPYYNDYIQKHVQCMLYSLCVSFFFWHELNRVQKLFKRKDQLRLSEMWVSENVPEVTECNLPSDTTFVIGWPGWPIVNYVAAFSTPEERKLWFTLLSK